jgi:hypothetical protein
MQNIAIMRRFIQITAKHSTPTQELLFTASIAGDGGANGSSHGLL